MRCLTVGSGFGYKALLGRTRRSLVSAGSCTPSTFPGAGRPEAASPEGTGQRCQHRARCPPAPAEGGEGGKKKIACLQLPLPPSHPERKQTHSNRLQNEVKTEKSLLCTEQRLHRWSGRDHCAPQHPSCGRPRAVVQHNPSGDPWLPPHSPHGKIPQEGVPRPPACPKSPATVPILCPASSGCRWLPGHTVIPKKQLNK